MLKKKIYHEPAFLRDIHHSQIRNYNQTKSMNISERIDYLVKQADEQVARTGYRIAIKSSPKFLTKV